MKTTRHLGRYDFEMLRTVVRTVYYSAGFFQTGLSAGSAGCLRVNHVCILPLATWVGSLVFRCLVT